MAVKLGFQPLFHQSHFDWELGVCSALTRDLMRFSHLLVT